MLARSQKTLAIEAMVKEGQSISSIARQMGVDRAWVQQVKRRLLGDYELATQINRRLLSNYEVASPAETPSPSGSPMKALTICLTPAVHDALVEACEVANRQTPEEPITINEYVEECIINRVVELGLLRRNKRK